MATLDDFANNMDDFGKRIEDNAETITRKVAIAVDTALVLATPVDTGRARSNWQVQLDVPATGARDAYVEGSGGSTVSENSQRALDHAKRSVAGYKSGKSIFITNNLSYIGKLNEGSSAQAPAGFVQNAILIGVTAVHGSGSILRTRISED